MPIPSTLETAAALLRHARSPVATATADASIGVTLPSTTAEMAMAVVSTAAAATMTALASAQKDGSDGGGGSGDERGECRLLGPFALVVQLALGGLALLSLVFKRWRERPQRPLKIWFFDVSKQVFGSVLVHVANVFMSMLTSGRFSMKLEPASVQVVRDLLLRGGADEEYVPNPCSFYLLNLAIDTTLGIPILIGLLRVVTLLVSYTPLGKPYESIQSGHYGNPPKAWWWLKQSIIYFCGLFGMKICVLVLFFILPWISRVGDWALKWTEGNERIQIIFVMMLFPVIMNALQYYIIDGFIKEKETGHDRLATDDQGGEADPFADALEDSDDDSNSGESSQSLKMVNSNTPKNGPKRRPEDGQEAYNPAVDGEPVQGDGKSQEGRQKLLQEEMIPPE